MLLLQTAGTAFAHGFLINRKLMNHNKHHKKKRVAKWSTMERESRSTPQQVPGPTPTAPETQGPLCPLYTPSTAAWQPGTRSGPFWTKKNPDYFLWKLYFSIMIFFWRDKTIKDNVVDFLKYFIIISKEKLLTNFVWGMKCKGWPNKDEKQIKKNKLKRLKNRFQFKINLNAQPYLEPNKSQPSTPPSEELHLQQRAAGSTTCTKANPKSAINYVLTSSRNLDKTSALPLPW